MDELTHEVLTKYLNYNPDTGIFTRIIRSGRAKAGSIAGALSGTGYIYIGILGKYYRANRLAFLYMTGNWPVNLIDHINRIRTDDRWINLREATLSQNIKNSKLYSCNKHGSKGVRPHSGKWQARGRLNGKEIYLGLHKTKELAVEAFEEFSKKHWGEFHNG